MAPALGRRPPSVAVPGWAAEVIWRAGARPLAADRGAATHHPRYGAGRPAASNL
ncbi:MAG: hypothetical protein WKG07_07200 [Hymenobacter sp.]